MAATSPSRFPELPPRPTKAPDPLISSNRLRKTLQSLLPVAALALLAFVVRDYVVSRTTSDRDLIESLPVLPAEVAAQSQRWQWTQTSGDSTRIEVSADDFVQGSDGNRTDLRGVVLKIFRDDDGSLDRVESAAMRMLAGGDLYSEGETVITLGVKEDASGGQPTVVTTSGVTFRPGASSASTDQAVRYRFAGGEGRSAGAVYDAGTGTLRMLSDVHMERFGEGADQPSTVIRAGGLRYSEREARIELTGGARIEQGGRWLDCETGVIRLVDGRIRRIDGFAARGGEAVGDRRTRFAAQHMESEFGADGGILHISGRDGTEFASVESGQRVEVRGAAVDLHYESVPESDVSALRRVAASGSARASVEPSESGGLNTIESESLLLLLRPGSSQIEQVETLEPGVLRQAASEADGSSRTLEAGRIRLRFGAAGGLERLTAGQGAQFLQRSADPASADLRTWSDTLQATLDPATSEITSLRQSGSFRFEEDARRGAADRAQFDPAGGELELDGAASVSGAGSVLSARHITVDRASGRVEARGDVTGSLVQAEPAADDTVPTGLFSADQAVYFSAGALTSDPEAESLQCRDGARLWQGGNRVDADLISIDQASQRITARANVAATWVDGRAEGAEQDSTATVRSEEMLYAEETGTARFSGAVDFRRQGMRVLSDALETALGNHGEGAAESAVASGTVRIAEPADGSGHRGFADRAEFRSAQSEVVLTGEPARIVAPDGTASEGGSLTYRLSGDSLLVLGHGGERAYTHRPASR